MQQAAIYLLSVLLFLSMGGAFHHHDGYTYSVRLDESVFLDTHNCNTHGNPSDSAHNYYCQYCSRIVTSSIFDSFISELGGIVIIHEILIEQFTFYSNVEFFRISEPRSPPQIS